nr:DENN domain containing protein 1A [Hymenolepis microstoma]
MFNLINRDAECIFNYFVIYENFTKQTRIIFPSDTISQLVDRIIEFGIGCCKVPLSTEFYILLFTDGTGRPEYVHCLQTSDGIFICFTSYLPWFDCFHRILEEVKSKELFKPEKLQTLRQFLDKIKDIKPPPAIKNAISIPYPLPNTSEPQTQGRNPPMDIRLLIPTSNHPYFLKAFEQYYSSLEPLQWIDIFTSMLLEKSILFYSKSRQRLTCCIIAAISLLFPLSWASPIYPILPRKLLPFLESPVPFIAGIHACMFEEAKSYITYGTRVVDLDGQQIYVNMPTEELDDESVPAPILDFFGVEFYDRNRFLKSAMNTKGNEFARWKTSKLPIQNYLVHQAEPFFFMLVNLLGYYGECKNAAGQVDFQQMIACQACPPLEPFLQRLYESQMVHCFVDDRLSEHTVDNFDIQARLLVNKCKERLMQSSNAKPNFGDLRWIECKRSITPNGVINNLRLRRKLGRKLVKLTNKAVGKSSKSNQDKKGIEKTTGRSPSLEHSKSTVMTKSGMDMTYDSSSSNYRATAARATLPAPGPGIHRNSNSSASTRTSVTARPLQLTLPVSSTSSGSTKTGTRSTYFERYGAIGERGYQENLPSPEEYLTVPPGITLGSTGITTSQSSEVSEIPITPTAVSLPHPPIPPKNFSHLPPGIFSQEKQQHRSAAPPPIPRRSFPNGVPITNFSSSNNSSGSSSVTTFGTWGEQHSNTPPPALPPRRTSLIPTHSATLAITNRRRNPISPLPTNPVLAHTTMTSFSLANRVNSTPELLDESEEKESGSSNSGSMLASSVGSAGNGGEGGIEGLNLLGLKFVPVFSRSDESISPLYMAYPRESAI